MKKISKAGSTNATLMKPVILTALVAILFSTNLFSQGITKLSGSPCINAEYYFQFIAGGPTCSVSSWNLGGATQTYISADKKFIKMKWSTSGSKTITCSFSNCTGAGTSPAQYSLTINPDFAPNISISVSNANPCQQSQINFIASGQNGTSPNYNWYVDGQYVGGGGSSTYTYTASSAGNHNVYCILNSGQSCASPSQVTSNTVGFTVTSKVSYSVNLSGPAMICSGNPVGTFYADVVGSQGTLTYQWYKNGSPVGTGNPLVNQPVAQGNTIYCSVSSNFWCINTPVSSNTYTVNLTTSVTPTSSVSPNKLNFCNGENITFTASSSYATGSSVYSWYLNGGFLSSGASNTKVLPASTTTGAGVFSPTSTISVSVSNITGACLNSATADGSFVGTPITVYALPVGSASNPTICSGATTSVTLNSTIGGTTFAWTVSAPNISGAAASSGATIAQTLTQTTTTNQTATYTVTPTANGCAGATFQVVVTVKPLPTFTPVPPTASIWSSGAAQYTPVFSIGGTTYTWTASATAPALQPSPNTGTTAINQTLYNPGPTAANVTYAITPTVNSCVGATQNFVVTVNPGPAIIVTGANNGNFVLANVTLDAGAGYNSYAWTRGSTSLSTTQTCVTTVPDLYTVTVTKTGITGTGFSTFVLNNQFSGLVENYIATNTILVDNIPDIATVNSLVVSQRSQNVQYFDGLGRPLQTVSSLASPLTKDIIQPVQYDGFGREATKYLPYVSTEANGWLKSNPLNNGGSYTSSLQYGFYNNSADKVADDVNPYAQTLFEPSPINRVLKQGAAGAAWQPNSSAYSAPTDHTIKNSYETNAASSILMWTYVAPTGPVPLGLAYAGTAASPVYYAANELYVNRTKDEQNNEVITYTDKAGRMVLKRVQAVAGTPTVNDVNYASTYYVYDDFGSLVVVLPPEATSRVANEYHQAGWTDASKDSFLARWAFRYTYDARRRMSQKQVPGAGAVYMVYDNRDRLILTEDANQRVGGTKYWSFTKYDVLNRPIMTGIRDTSAALTQAQMQAVVDAHFAKASARWGETFIGTAAGNVHGYTNRAYPVRTGAAAEVDAFKYLTATYYDDYSAKTLFYDSSTYSFATTELPGEQATNYFKRLLGKVTATKVKVLDGGVMGGFTFLNTVNYYDDKARLIQTVTDNFKGGIDRTTSVYDFAGKVLKSKTIHIERDIAWKDKVNVAVLGNKLVSTSGATWGAGAASVQTLAAGVDGWVEFVVSENNLTRMLGLSDMNVDAGYTSLDYAWQLSSSGSINVYENGTSRGSSYPYKPGDFIKIERTGTTIKYYQNGVLRYTSTVASSSLLMVDCSFYNVVGTSIANVRSSFSFTSRSILRRFVYDHSGRHLKTFHSLDGAPEVLLAQNSYNELGQLVEKNLHSTDNGATFKQYVDYRYNIRGWLASMNNAALSNDGVTNDDTGDLFGMNLNYDQVDASIGNTGLFNGNISAMTWSNNLGLGTVKQNGYLYVYDPLNRITGSSFKEKAASWSSPANNAFSENGYAYDLNGNILAMTRYDRRTSGSMDNLVYDYGTGSTRSNKLLNVTDNGDDFLGFIDGTNAGNDYSYDVNGNMITDQNKGISSLISYNFLSLPELISRGGNTVRYIYDATGRKLSQVATFTNSQKRTDYSGEFTYENDGLQFVNHEEGRIAMASTKMVYSNSGEGTSDVTASNATVVTVVQNGAEKYIKATSNGTVARSGMFPIGGTINVTAGERYRIRAKGYHDKGSAASSSTAYLLIKANGIDLDWAGASLPASSATAQTESWAEQIVTVPPGATTLQAGVIWNTVLTGNLIFLNEFEITKLEVATPEYQYHLKDHLGNVRLTFTSVVTTDQSTGTLEDANATAEQGQFLRYANAKRVNAAIFDHTNGAATGYSQRLNGSANEKYGLAKSLSVMPGDVITAEVYAKYVDPATGNWTAALNTLMGQIAAGQAGVVVDGAGYSTSTSSFPVFSGVPANTVTTTGPKAYLNWLVFDRSYNFIASGSGYVQMTTAAKEAGSDVPHERLYSPAITISQPGYVYIYLSNEEATPVEVYFDDFKVTQTKSPVIQTDDYYPFGLTFNSYSRENSVPNKYKFGGKEEQADLALNTVDFGWRQYDPAIGRWNVIDQWAEKYHTTSPYAFVQDNPISHQEIDGRWFDEKNEKKAEKYEHKLDKRIGKLEKQIAKLEAKGKDIDDRKDRVGELKQSKTDISNMRGNKQTEFRYASASDKSNPAGVGNPTTERTGTNQVTMFTGNSMGSVLHEGRHGGQEARGELGNNYQNYGVQDEVSAYRAQYAYDGSMKYVPQSNFNDPANVMKLLMGGIQAFQQTVTNISQITPGLVNTLVDSPGINQKLIYPPAGISIQQWNGN